MAAKVGGPGSTQPRVLIIDDNAYIRMLLRMNLELRFDVEETDNGADALRRIRDGEHFDLVITDILQPGMNGIEFTQHVHEDMPALPVVVLSAWVNKANAHVALEAGAWAVLPKPFGPTELIGTLTGLLD
jgi:CheY-like chemotaxis protein